MPDGSGTTRDLQTVQRGFMQRFPGGGFRQRNIPRGGFPRRVPIRRRFPAPVIFPIFYGFPYGRCDYVDRFGRCCDRFGRCCDRWGRCYYGGYDTIPVADSGSGWYGVPGGWDMMPDMDDMDDIYNGWDDMD